MYPAAPPTKVPNLPEKVLGFFVVVTSIRFILVVRVWPSRLKQFSKKNNHLRVVVVLEVEFFAMFLFLVTV